MFTTQEVAPLPLCSPDGHGWQVLPATDARVLAGHNCSAVYVWQMVNRRQQLANLLDGKTHVTHRTGCAPTSLGLFSYLAIRRTRRSRLARRAAEQQQGGEKHTIVASQHNTIIASQHNTIIVCAKERVRQGAAQPDKQPRHSPLLAEDCTSNRHGIGSRRARLR